jgi:hypothetical protein
MKPIPVGFCEAADHAVIHGRPWWRQEGDQLWRRDGLRVSLVDFDDEIMAPVSRTAEVEHIDDKDPLPHPGFRAGQVWIRPDRTTVVCLEAWEEGPRSRLLPSSLGYYRELYLLHDPLMPSRAPWSSK